jgi:hypothetical protein
MLSLQPGMMKKLGGHVQELVQVWKKVCFYKYILCMTALLNIFFRVSLEEEIVKKVYRLRPR